MSIEFARGYKTSDGKCHGTLTEAQRHELYIVLGESFNDQYEEILDKILNESSRIVNILTMTERSRPKARGSKKPRKNRVTEPATTTAA